MFKCFHYPIKTGQKNLDLRSQAFLLKLLLSRVSLFTGAPKESFISFLSPSCFIVPMASLAYKRIGLLTCPGFSSLLVVPVEESWAQCPIMDNHFSEATISSCWVLSSLQGYRRGGLSPVLYDHPEGDNILIIVGHFENGAREGGASIGEHEVHIEDPV